MKCPNCNQEVTGKFCNYCGAPLEPDSTKENLSFTEDREHTQTAASARPKQTQTTTVTQKTKVKKKKKKQKKGTIKNTLSGGASTVGSVAAGSVRTTWKLVFLALQWICGALMLLVTWELFAGCWAQRTTLGSIMGVVSEKNINQAAYLILAICFIAFGLLQTIWIISRKKMPDNGKTRRMDMGRGIFGFAVMLILAVAARFAYPLIPEHPYPLPGLRLFLSVVSGLGTRFIFLNLVGVILSIVRKI